MQSMKAIMLALIGQNRFTLPTSTKVCLAPEFTVQLYSSIKWAKHRVCATSFNRNDITCLIQLRSKNIRKDVTLILVFTVVMVLVCALALATSCLEDSLWPIKAGMPEIIFNN